VSGETGTNRERGANSSRPGGDGTLAGMARKDGSRKRRGVKAHIPRGGEETPTDGPFKVNGGIDDGVTAGREGGTVKKGEWGGTRKGGPRAALESLGAKKERNR